MLATSLVNGIIKRGGTAELSEPIGRAKGELFGTLNGNDVHAYLSTDYEQDERPRLGYFTVRPISRRGDYDPYSDYNPHGYLFVDKVKDLDWACR